ncbi:MAG: sigma-70 family RNA polymerase sigma factor [Actinomycetia bacterium]|nr:sigma-70 family RNA polymerase sigma factor [Actinomycetes bacterium]
MPRATTDVALVTQAQSGDLLAERELVARYRFLVITIINREGFFSRSGTQDDLMQHGYIGLLAAIRTYNLGRGAKFKTYAATCIRNEIVSALRSEHTKKHGALTIAQSLDGMAGDGESIELTDEFAPTPEERMLAAEYAGQLMRFIESELSDLEKEVFIRYARGYSYSEIAHQLGKTPKAVDGTLQRVRKKMTLRG